MMNFSVVFAQQKQPLSISFMPKTGFLISHRAIMSHLVKDRNTAFELEFSQQDNRTNNTAIGYRFLSRGFSLHYQDFGYASVLGQSYSVLQFTKFNLIQHQKIGFIDFRVGSGISYITKEYDAQINPKNNAIGSKWNAFVNLQLVYSYYFKSFLIGGGVEISHFSNAAITVPNLGLNTPMCFLKMGYAITQRAFFKSDYDTTVLKREVLNKFQFNAIGGVKQNLPGHHASIYFPVFSAQALYRIQLGFKWDVETGLDLVYNAANRYKYDNINYSFGETVQLGVYLGACANFYKSQVFFGLGVYALNKINPAGWVYNRIGYRYNFTTRFNALVAIKANLGIADYLEMGIGWRL